MSQRHLRELAALVATAHVAVVILDLGGRSVIYPGEAMLGLVADHPWWTALHTLAAVAIATTTTARRLEWAAMGLSACVMGVWSALILAWRLGATPPLPLLGPTLGLIVAALAMWLAHYWTDPEE